MILVPDSVLMTRKDVSVDFSAELRRLADLIDEKKIAVIDFQSDASFPLDKHTKFSINVNFASLIY